MKFSDALAPIDDVGEKVMDTTEEYVKKADDVILGRVMRVMDHVSMLLCHLFIDTAHHIVVLFIHHHHLQISSLPQ